MQPTPSGLSRRDFLRASALAAGALATLGSDLRGAPAMSTKVIDAHIHLYDTTRPGGIGWPSPKDTTLYAPHLPSDFAALTAKFGVVGAIVIEGNAEPVDNQWVLDLASDHPSIVAYIGRLAPGAPDFATHFDRYVRSPVFRGLRISQPMFAKGWGTAGFETDLQRLAERALTLDVVGGSPVLGDVLRVAKLAPNLRQVIDHLPFKEWDSQPEAMRDALREVAALPNVYAKVSNVARLQDGRLVKAPAYYRPGLDVLWELFGNDRVIYGSNWPVSDHVAPYGEIFQIAADYVQARERTDPGAAEKYFWKNSAAAYQWQPRG